MKSLSWKRWSSLLLSSNAYASTTGSNLPFVSPLHVIEQAITGPVLLYAAIIMIVVTCVMLAFGEWGDGFKRFLNIIMWLGVAFGTVSLVTTLWGGGALC